MREMREKREVHGMREVREMSEMSEMHEMREVHEMREMCEMRAHTGGLLSDPRRPVMLYSVHDRPRQREKHKQENERHDEKSREKRGGQDVQLGGVPSWRRADDQRSGALSPAFPFSSLRYWLFWKTSSAYCIKSKEPQVECRFGFSLFLGRPDRQNPPK